MTRTDMPAIWMQTKAGRVGDMVHPENNTIDFIEIADTLSHINRYNGCGHRKQVSVAFHTVICCSMAPAPLKPYMLLHDCHEAFIGDITTPAAMALAAVAEAMTGDSDAKWVVKDALSELKWRHDIAIHKAAGVPYPERGVLIPGMGAGQEIQAQIRHYDLRALNTERHEFLAPEPAAWGDMIVSAGRDSRSWADNWMPPDETADLLYSLFRQHLPALNKRREAA